MNKRALTVFAAGLAAILMHTPGASAQSYNPNARYANPNQSETEQGRRLGCRDPWVGLALARVDGRVDKAYCGTYLYNGGQWGDFNTLVHAVARTRGGFRSQGVELKLGKTPNGTVGLALIKGGRMVAAGGGNLITDGGSTLVGNDGSSLVAIPANLLGNDGGSLKYAAPGVKIVQSRGSVALPMGMLHY